MSIQEVNLFNEFGTSGHGTAMIRYGTTCIAKQGGTVVLPELIDFKTNRGKAFGLVDGACLSIWCDEVKLNHNSMSS